MRDDAARRPQPDDVLVARLQAGDDRALRAVYDELGGMVFGLAIRVTRDEQLASEITQDVFVYLWEAPHRVDLSRGSLRSFLGVVAHRRSVDAVRRGAARRRAEGAASDLRESTALLEDDIATMDARAWCSERVLAALDELPAEQREALVLAYFDGLPYKEVARRLGIPEGTAKSRIRLGLARVRMIAGDDLIENR